MFLEEARLGAELHHPNIVDIYEIGEERRAALHRHGVHRGPHADRRGDARPSRSAQPLPRTYAAHIVAQVAEALAYLQDGLARARPPAARHRPPRHLAAQPRSSATPGRPRSSTSASPARADAGAGREPARARARSRTCRPSRCGASRSTAARTSSRWARSSTRSPWAGACGGGPPTMVMRRIVEEDAAAAHLRRTATTRRRSSGSCCGRWTSGPPIATRSPAEMVRDLDRFLVQAASGWPTDTSRSSPAGAVGPTAWSSATAACARRARFRRRRGGRGERARQPLDFDRPLAGAAAPSWRTLCATPTPSTWPLGGVARRSSAAAPAVGACAERRRIAVRPMRRRGTAVAALTVPEEPQLTRAPARSASC